jgi:ABC-type glycerol-3-phosphate transport system substrate-binding protein
LKNYNKVIPFLLLVGFTLLFSSFIFVIPVRTYENPKPSQGINLTIHAYDQQIPGIKNVTANFLASPLGSGVDSVTVISAGTTYDQTLTYLTALMQSGTATADVINLDVTWTADFAENYWITPLDDYLGVNELDAYVPGLVDACQYKNKYYAYPYFLNLGALYYRKDLLDLHFGPGMWSEADFDTWEELNQTANFILNNQSGLLTSADSALVGYVGQFDAYEGGVINFFEWCGSNGALDLITSYDEVNINTTNAINAVSFLKGLFAPQSTSVQGTPYIIPREALIYDEGASILKWTQEESIFMRQWTFAYTISKNFNLDFGVLPLPHFEGASGYKTSVVGGSILAIPTATTGTAREAALNYIKFLGDPLAQERELTADVSTNPGVQPLSNFPALKSVYNNPPNGFDWIKNWTDQLDLTLSRPINAMYPSISNIIANNFSNIISCQFSASDGMDIMQKKISKLLFKLQEIYVDIVGREYTSDTFKISFYLSSLTGNPIDDATIQGWWNGDEVSSSFNNLGNGNYSVNLTPIWVDSGDPPILLNMTISAEGYSDKYFESYIAVPPEQPVSPIPGYGLFIIYITILGSVIMIYLSFRKNLKKIL